MIFLRARYLTPSSGRYIQKDPSRLEKNLYLYVNGNPLKYTDPTGLSPQVECEQIMYPEMRSLCEVANGNDYDPDVIEARVKFFEKIAKMSKGLGVTAGVGLNEGYFWAGQMLEYFLNGETNINIRLPSTTTFKDDPGILRATTNKTPPRFGGNEEPAELTPLIHVFLEEYVQPQLGCDSYQTLATAQILGKNTFYPEEPQPRPYRRGWWGAFGHVVVDASYSNISVIPNADKSGYVIKTLVNYNIDDKYEWFPEKGMTTPLPLGYPYLGSFPPIHGVLIPHGWEQSLVDAGRAYEFDFTVTWSENLQIVVPNDFSRFLIMNKGVFQLE